MLFKKKARKVRILVNNSTARRHVRGVAQDQHCLVAIPDACGQECCACRFASWHLAAKCPRSSGPRATQEGEAHGGVPI